MDGGDKPLIRAVGLIVLVALSLVALRSYLPEVTLVPQPTKPRDNSRSIALQLLLCGAIAILVLLSLRRRHRRHMPQSAESPSYLRLRGLTRREALIAAATAISLVALAWLSLYLTKPAGESPARDPASGSAEPSQSNSTNRAPTKPAERDRPDTPMIVLAAVLVGIGVVILVLRGRDPDAAVDGTDPVAAPNVAETSPRSLVHLVELGLAEVAEPGRDPRTSIIACYAAMEQGLTSAPEAAPLESDTPSEVLQRAVHIGALQSHAGTQLVALFSEARFSPHRMTQADREAAARCLQSVLDDLRSRQ